MRNKHGFIYRIIAVLAAIAMVITMVPAMTAKADETIGDGSDEGTDTSYSSPYEPYACVDFTISSSVTQGVVRYVNQTASGSYQYFDSYWTGVGYPEGQCNLSAVSMALSYIGINKLPKKLVSGLMASNWGGCGYEAVQQGNYDRNGKYSYLGSSGVQEKFLVFIQRYLSGYEATWKKYSPIVIHLNNYGSGSHYLTIIGKKSESGSKVTYETLDPWDNHVTEITIDTSTTSLKCYYNYWGSKRYDTIDEVYQYFNQIEEPTMPTVSNTTNYVKVKWNYIDEADGYYVYRKIGSGSYSKIATVAASTSPYYKDTEIAASDYNGKKILYKIKAFSIHDVSDASAAGYTYRMDTNVIKKLTSPATRVLKAYYYANTAATGYQIQVARDSSFTTGKITTTVTGYSNTSYKVRYLTKGKTYYARVRSYKQVSGTKYYSAWSEIKSFRIK